MERLNLFTLSKLAAFSLGVMNFSIFLFFHISRSILSFELFVENTTF